MKKSSLILLTVIALCLICFTACNDGGVVKPDETTYTETYSEAHSIVLDATEDEYPTDGAETSATTDTTKPTTPAEPPTEAHVCSFGEWQTVKDAACLEYGMQERYCKCGEKQTQMISAYGHSVRIEAAVAPTCTEPGLSEGKYCTTCGDTLVAQRTVAALGHAEISHAAKESTCTEVGWHAYVTCQRCDYSTYEELELAPHDHDELGEACSACGAVKFSDGLYFESNGDGTCSVSCAMCEHGDQLYIPAVSPSGDVVTSIGKEGFADCSGIVSVTIPDTVTTIAEMAFYRCTSLESIEIPENVQVIGSGVFDCCIKLENVEIKGDIESIGSSAFFYCTALTDIKISGNIGSVGVNAFCGCEALENVYMADIASWCAIDFMDDRSNPLYYADNFYIDGERVEYLVIADEITSIGNRAFFGYHSLKGVQIGENVTSIGEQAFNECVNLAEITVASGNTVYKTINNNLYSKDGRTFIQYALGQANTAFDIPLGVEYIDIGAFALSEHLSAVYIPNTVKEIGEKAFYSCWSISNITIPDSVVYIGDSAFATCLYLNNVTIGSGVKTIDDYAFHNCLFLRSVTIPNNVEYIGTYAFAYSSFLSRVVIEDAAPGADSTMTIGKGAFFNSNNLTDVIIGSSVAHIGDWAFDACSNLVNVTISDSVKSVGETVFDITEKLKYNEYGNACYVGNDVNPYLVLFTVKDNTSESVEIHSDTEIIAEWAFFEMEHLSEIYIPASVRNIGTVAFNMCTSLSNITVDSANTAYMSINGDLYSIDGKILLQYAIGKTDTTFVLADGVERIADQAFAYAEYLEIVVLPDCIEEIGKSAFYFCENLREVNLPDNISVIAYEAFAFCRSLVSVNISDKVTNIYDRTFYCCESLETITFGNGITDIGDYVLDGCYNITTVNYNGTMEQWNAINKGYAFERDLRNCTVYCTDGEISE